MTECVYTWVCMSPLAEHRALNEARPATRDIPPVWLALCRLIKTGLVHGFNTYPLLPPFPSFFGALRNLSSPLDISFLPFFISSLPPPFALVFSFSFAFHITHLRVSDFPRNTTTTHAHKHDRLHSLNAPPVLCSLLGL